MAERYAQGTTVAAERSRFELERLLRRFNASHFGYGWGEGQEQIAFKIAGRSMRLTLPMPDPDSVEFTQTPAGRARTASAAKDAYEAEVRRRWRSLVLVVKAKFAAVQDGISTIEREFLADVVIPGGQTFGEWVAPQLAEIGDGKVPIALPRGGGR